MSLTCERRLVSSRSLSLCGGPAGDECLAVRPGRRRPRGPARRAGAGTAVPSLQAAFRIGSYECFLPPFLPAFKALR